MADNPKPRPGGRPKRRARLAAGLPKPAPVQAPRKPPPRYVMHAPKIPPDKWRAMTVLDQVVAIFGMSLDDVHELMEIPFAEADLHEKGLKIRVYEIQMKFAYRLDRERDRQRGRDEVLDEMRRALDLSSGGEDRVNISRPMRVAPKRENGVGDG